MERLREVETPFESLAGSPFFFPKLLVEAARGYGHRVAFTDFVDGCVRELSFTECLFWSNTIAQRLATVSTAPRCIIFSESRIEWPLAFFGVLGAGGVVVPIDTRSTAYELADSLCTIKPGVLLVSPKLLALAEEAAAIARWCGSVVLMSLRDEEDKRAFASMEKHAIDLDQAQRNDDDVAMIVFTAGTCGDPKPVKLSFRNIFHQVQALREALVLKPGDAFLSVLPSNNVVEIVGNLLAAFVSGCHVHFPRSLFPKELTRAIKQWKITHMIVVPRLMQFMEAIIKSHFRIKYGEDGEPRLSALQSVSTMTSSITLRRNLSGHARGIIGPSLQRILVCGASLNPSVLRFFYLLGVNVLQSYGLVEASGLATINLPDKSRLGSAGVALPGTEIRIDAAGEEKIGEILIRGPNVLNGYFSDDDLMTATVDDEGWLHTGDLGFLTHDGFLYIVDRKANTLVLDDGSKVYPSEIEKKLIDSPLFDEVCVTPMNDDTSLASAAAHLCAIVVPKAGLLKLRNSSELQALCESEVFKKTASLPGSKRPGSVIVRTVGLPKTCTGYVKFAQLGAQ